MEDTNNDSLNVEVEDNISQTIELEPQELSGEIDLKEVRKRQWINGVEAELRVLLNEAMKIRQNITTAKTQTKKTYFNKKFKKVNAQIRQCVSLLGQLGGLPKNEDVVTEEVITDGPVT